MGVMVQSKVARFYGPRCRPCAIRIRTCISADSLQWHSHLEPNSTTRTPATNTTNGHQRTSSQQFYNLLYNKFTNNADKNLPHPNILTCRDVGLWHCDVANCCRIVVSSSVGGVRSRSPCSGVWRLACNWSRCYWYPFDILSQVATNLENLEYSGISLIMENSGNSQGIPCNLME